MDQSNTPLDLIQTSAWPWGMQSRTVFALRTKTGQSRRRNGRRIFDCERRRSQCESSELFLQLPHTTKRSIASRNAKLPRWRWLRFRQYHRENPVPVCHFGPVPVDLMWDLDRSFESPVSALHDTVASALMLSLRSFHSAYHEHVAADRNIEVLLLHARHLDTDDHRLRRLPSLSREQ